ncbi:DNRLRE domain-containing protein [Nonomuraea sp. 3-1Str]|uniref:DNRLRE domain-containing protein n=1 Tax=Nonomuraea sp. 3-1Str TaxID=2929801 RepID=UPI00285ED2DD|nr:DNRLRE domain-containing protein [Nonomuraea sp. 3-1Str]MDR8408507.1 DNRLRE domain-containing protein [Nonomuraea sp. 3-1Str]
MELHSQPVRVKNTDGKGFTPIDTTLVEQAGVIKPKAINGTLTLSAGQDKTLLKSQATASADTAKITTPSTLPKPTLKGNTARYPAAYGKGRDLLVTATATGFRQQVVITERPTGPVTFKMPVALPTGLSFSKNAQGQPIIVGKDSETLTEVRPTLLQDATAADAYAPIDAGKVGKAAISLDDDGKSLVFTPDATFLADPAVTYPVTMAAVAADWWETHTGAGGLPQQGWDTFVNNADYQDSWYNFNLDRILVGKSNSGTVRWRSYIKFPDMPAEFRGLKVQNADLILWNHLSNDCGTYVGSGITTRRITSAWDEATMTWNSQPSVTSTGQITEYAAYSPNCTSGAASWAGKEWDLVYSIDEIAQAWSNGETNYGVQLTAGSESDSTNWRRYRTDEAGGCRSTPLEACKGQLHPPILTVDFLLPPKASVVMLDAGETAPTTKGEIGQLAARGRVSNTLPQPDPISEAEAAEYRRNSDQDYVASPEDVEAPLPPPTDDLAGRWSFDEASGTQAADASGNGHHATVNSGTSWTPGVRGSAVTNIAATTGSRPKPEGPQAARAMASGLAAGQGRDVEVTEETTATSITYALRDGRSFRTEVAAGPVRTKRNGGWVPIDTTLRTQDGRLTPNVIADGVAVELSAGGTDALVKMTADGKSYALRWPTPLPKPMVKGSVATYTDAAGVGADLVVTVLPTGFRHEVVLRQKASKPLELRIGVDDDGLTLTEGMAGRLLLRSKDKKLVASAPQPIMWDGSAKGRYPLAKTSKVNTEVVTKNGRTELVLKPDHQFLTDSATTYPVRIQPMAASTSSEDVTLASTDTVDWPASPGNPIMIAGVQQTQKMRSYLRFPTGSLQGQTVTDAKVSLYNFESSACGASVGDGLQVRRVTGAWDTDNLYWANKPAATTEDAQTNKAGYDLTCSGGAQRLEWNVTGIAQDWAAGAADHGLVVQSPTEGTTTNWRYVTASEDTDFNQPPTLTITTSGPASQPVVSNLAITPAQSVNGVTVTTSLAPQLAATVADTASGRLTGEFEVEHDPAATGQGSGQIWAGASAVVTSGGQATVSVPAGKLADGWKIRWRARASNATAATTSAWSAWQMATVDVPNPAVTGLQVTPSTLVEGVTVSTSVTPSLLATVTDPGGQPVRAEFEIEHDPATTGQGTGQIWAGTVDNIASGSQASATVPDGKLTDGWKIRWRARAVNPSTTVASPWAGWQSVMIDVADPVSEPAVTALRVDPSQVVDGKTHTASLTPSLLAQVSDPAGGRLRAEFEVEHDPAATGQGTGQIWAGGVDDVASGSQASATIPASTLADGWQIRWRARAVSPTAASAWSEWQSLAVALPKPTVSGLAVVPSAVIGGTTVITSLTPAFMATVTDPGGQSVRAEFEVDHDPAATGQGTGQIWAGASAVVTSGGQATVSVPAGKLADGWKIRWRARAVNSGTSTASPWTGWSNGSIDLTPTQAAPLAQTSGSVMRTDQAFTVGAWLKWDDKDGGYSVIEQRGEHQAAFTLGNDPEHGLVFTFTGSDQAAPAVEGVLSGVEPPVGEWFHLAGTFDPVSKVATLYLNGNFIGTSQLSFASWNASGPTMLGASMRGMLDETWLFSRALESGEVFALYDGSSASAAEGAGVAARAAAPAPRYDRVDPDDCRKLHGWLKRSYGYLKNRYSGCWRHAVQVMEPDDEEDSGDRDEVHAMQSIDIMFVAKTWSGLRELESASARDIWFDLYIGTTGNVNDVWNRVESVLLTIGMEPARSQTACQHVTSFGGATQVNHLTKSVEDWTAMGVKVGDTTTPWKKAGTFRLTAPQSASPDPVDNITSCDFQPYAAISFEDEGDDDGEWVEWRYGTTQTKMHVRCDNAEGVSRRKGGCILPVIPSVQWKLGNSYDAAYVHYWSACYNKAVTFPYNPQKTIPGCAVNGTARPPANAYLARTGRTPTQNHDQLVDNIRARAVTRCRSLWPGYGAAGQECDEYPYAAASNRTVDTDKAGHLSVCAMPGGKTGPNQIAGKVLNRLFNEDRVIFEDHFFNRFATTLTNPPRMEDHCWPGHINTSSPYYTGVG